MTEAKGPYIYAKGDDIVASVGNVSVTVKIGNSDEAIIANMAYARGVADERERAARVALRNGTRRIDDPRMPAEVGSNIAEEIRKG